MSAAEIGERAKQSYRNASLVIDAEVTMPMKFGPELKPGLMPMAYLRVIRVWKGHVKGDLLPVVYVSSCDVGLEQKGQKVRILLSGDGVFRADQAMNGAGVSDVPAFNAEMDRLLGQQRSPAFARFPGEELPPSMGKKAR